EGAPAEHDTVSGRNAVDSHLRSAKELRGYLVRSTDDSSLGSVDDFLVDDTTWQVRYVVIDTGGVWADERLFVATEDVRGISWAQKMVFVQALPCAGAGDILQPRLPVAPAL
ncbi:MAG TPA: PRC-barrel domain-containing protein, partial [Polyangiaceae bacterium]